MIVAQITDLHLGFEPDVPDELNRQRLDRVIAVLAGIEPQPDLLLVTGDVVEHGDVKSYAQFREAIAALSFPVCLAMGNHDDREAYRQVFPRAPSSDGFIQYAIEDHPVRVLVLDTLETGRHGGGFCEVRAAWLKARLEEAPERPTLIALHHPPIETGHSWMTENPNAAWIKRLKACIDGRSNIVALVSGHLHRPVVTRWAGTVLAVCPATAPLVALDFKPMDPDAPDGRPMIVTDEPWFALHYWNGRELVSHYDTAEEHESLATFSRKRLRLLHKLWKERAEA